MRLCKDFSAKPKYGILLPGENIPFVRIWGRLRKGGTLDNGWRLKWEIKKGNKTEAVQPDSQEKHKC